MTIIPTLYRGDSLPPLVASSQPTHRGRTWAQHYYRQGLMAKSNDCALGSDLSLPLGQLVAAHIGYAKSTAEERQAKHSPLISFSTRMECAGYFSDRSQKKHLATCGIEHATHFIWRLDVPDLDSGSYPGTFVLKYTASTKNVDHFGRTQVERVLAGDESSWLSAVITQTVHGHIRADSSLHSALVIEPILFLNGLRDGEVDSALLERALERAEEWSEWLVYPTDPMEDGKGFSARFDLNEYLNLQSWARVR